MSTSNSARAQHAQGSTARRQHTATTPPAGLGLGPFAVAAGGGVAPAATPFGTAADTAPPPPGWGVPGVPAPPAGELASAVPASVFCLACRGRQTRGETAGMGQLPVNSKA
jgi:hypothetical protein